MTLSGAWACFTTLGAKESVSAGSARSPSDEIYSIIRIDTAASGSVGGRYEKCEEP